MAWKKLRVSGGDHDTAPVAIFRPGTISAADLHVCSTHYDTVVHYARILDPEGFERALAAVELFAADEFVEESMQLAA